MELAKFISIYATDSTPKNTIISYNNRYKRIIKLLEVDDLSEIEDNEIIARLSSVDSGNSRKALLNLIILIRETLYAYEVDDLRNERDNTNNLIKEQKMVSNEQLNLPSFYSINEHMMELYKRKSWREFIINYLLINFMVRNADLDLQVVYRKQDMLEKDVNYIWVKSNHCIYYRNNYKTVNSYGSQIHNVESEQFQKAIRNIKGVLIPSANLAYYILKATGGLGEGRIFKIIIDYYRDKGQLQKIQEMAQFRGTNLQTIINEYDITLTHDKESQTDLQLDEESQTDFD